MGGAVREARQSGNPKGIPKLIKNFSDDLREEAKEILTIAENGKKVKITKQRALIKKMIVAALNGDKAMIKIFASLLYKLPIKSEELTEELSQSDIELIEDFIRRQTND